MKLSESESQVLQVFWQHGVNSAPQVHKVIEKIKPVSYSTVKTLIDRLEQKGALKRTSKEGRIVFYTAVAEPKVTKKPIVKSLIDRIFGGKPSELAAHIVEQETLNKQEIEYLESILAKRKKELNDD